MPIGFHRFIKHRLHLELSEVWTEAVKKWKKFPEKYDATKEFAEDYIQKVYTRYKNL